jgi:hypothetical protein
MLPDFDCKAGFRANLTLSLIGFGSLGLLLSGYILGVSYYSVSGYGDWGLPSQELVVWLCLLGMVIMAVSVLGIFLSRIRCAAVAVFIGSGLLVTLGVAALKSSDAIRMQGFERLAGEAAPLVEAINAYYEEHGAPPESLEQLQVSYPPGHTIKGDNLPEFTYVPDNRATERYHGNPWVLILDAPTGPLKWDKFLYYPLQNYPPLGHGGWFEKVGEWAYVHE